MPPAFLSGARRFRDGRGPAPLLEFSQPVMTPDAEIFADALELPAGERAQFLDRACARDSALRQRIEALLAAHAAARDFLEPPPAGRSIPPPGGPL